MANFATCGGCNELFEVRAERTAFTHRELGLSGLRTEAGINLCPGCEATARAKGQPPAPPAEAPAAEAPADAQEETS